MVWLDALQGNLNKSNFIKVKKKQIGFCWLQTDLPPHRDGLRPQYKWMADHSENLSGTAHQYAPFTTTTPKIEAWVPKGKN